MFTGGRDNGTSAKIPREGPTRPLKQSGSDALLVTSGSLDCMDVAIPSNNIEVQRTPRLSLIFARTWTRLHFICCHWAYWVGSCRQSRMPLAHASVEPAPGMRAMRPWWKSRCPLLASADVDCPRTPSARLDCARTGSTGDGQPCGSIASSSIVSVPSVASTTAASLLVLDGGTPPVHLGCARVGRAGAGQGKEAAV